MWDIEYKYIGIYVVDWGFTLWIFYLYDGSQRHDRDMRDTGVLF